MEAKAAETGRRAIKLAGRRRVLWIGIGAAILLSVSISYDISKRRRAEEVRRSPGLIVDLNEGIYLYLLAEEDSSQYDEAIGVFSSVLERDPANISALLFRALSYGDLGLEYFKSRRNAEYKIRQYNFVLKTRQDGSVVASYEENIIALE